VLLIFKSIKNTTSNIPVKREKINYAFQIIKSSLSKFIPIAIAFDYELPIKIW